MYQPGRRIGPFELRRRVGTGQGTELWLALPHEGEGPPVAIRLVSDPDDPDAIDAVRREYEELRLLDDPRIPRSLGFFQPPGAVAIEHVAGIRLRRVLAASRTGRIRLDMPTAMDIVFEVAHAARHAHSIVREGGRIVHGHISPDQVWLTAGGDVRVTGFGSLPERLDARCLPPEMAARASCDERVDQWQVAALLYAMATGGPLYDGPWAQAFKQALGGEVSAQLATIEAMNPRLASVLAKALAPDPAERYQVEAEFLRALHAVARDIGGSSRRREIAAAMRDEVEQPVSRPPEQHGLVARAAAWSRGLGGESVESVQAPAMEEPGEQWVENASAGPAGPWAQAAGELTRIPTDAFDVAAPPSAPEDIDTEEDPPVPDEPGSFETPRPLERLDPAAEIERSWRNRTLTEWLAAGAIALALGLVLWYAASSL